MSSQVELCYPVLATHISGRKRSLPIAPMMRAPRGRCSRALCARKCPISSMACLMHRKRRM